MTRLTTGHIRLCLQIAFLIKSRVSQFIVFLDLVFSATKGNTAPFYQTDNKTPYVPNDPHRNFVLFPLTFPSTQRIQVQTVLGPMISTLLYFTKAGNNFLKSLFSLFLLNLIIELKNLLKNSTEIMRIY